MHGQRSLVKSSLCRDMATDMKLCRLLTLSRVGFYRCVARCSPFHADRYGHRRQPCQLKNHTKLCIPPSNNIQQPTFSRRSEHTTLSFGHLHPVVGPPIAKARRSQGGRAGGRVRQSKPPRESTTILPPSGKHHQDRQRIPLIAR